MEIDVHTEMGLRSGELEDVEYFRNKMLHDQQSIKALREYELMRDAFIMRTLARIADNLKN